MGSRHLLGLCVLSVAVPGCAGSDASTPRPDGPELLERARAKARGAPYLVVDGPRTQRLQLTPRVTVISQRGRVMLWSRRDVEYALRPALRCYERYTEFSRGDIAETRRDTVVPYEVDAASVHTVGGRKVIRWRVDQESEAAGMEGSLALRRDGAPALARERTVRWGAIPPSRWYVRRYRYPSRLSVPVPVPACRA
jgi:hypothetical protein